MPEIKEMVKVAYDALTDKKAINTKIIDISNISVLADYFIIASGANEKQVQAMADNVCGEWGGTKADRRVSLCKLDIAGF